MEKLALTDRQTIAEEIVDNLIALHSRTTADGFGWIGEVKSVPSWQAYYHPVAASVVDKAVELERQGLLSSQVIRVLQQAMQRFDRIFTEMIEQPSLIHGDYNTWNIMLNHEKTHAIALIDPFHCGWADSEYDLYQLDNANGKDFGLLEGYLQKQGCSRLFTQKRCFYELFTEINHYYDSGVEPDQEAVEKLADRLWRQW